jgi:hypothetical protein
MDPRDGLAAPIVYLDECKPEATGLSRPTGWHYEGTMDTRETHVPHTSADFIKSATWTVS